MRFCGYATRQGAESLEIMVLDFKSFPPRSSCCPCILLRGRNESCPRLVVESSMLARQAERLDMCLRLGAIALDPQHT